MGREKSSRRAALAGILGLVAMGVIAFPDGVQAGTIAPHSVSPRPVSPHVVVPPPAAEPPAKEPAPSSSSGVPADPGQVGGLGSPTSAPPAPPPSTSRPVGSDELPTPQQKAEADAEDRYVRRFFCGAVNAIMVFAWGNSVFTEGNGRMVMGDEPQGFGELNALSNALDTFNRYCANWRSA